MVLMFIINIARCRDGIGKSRGEGPQGSLEVGWPLESPSPAMLTGLYGSSNFLFLLVANLFPT
jgi:hypothetical protein